MLILPGILGSKLSVESSGDSDLVWFNPARLALGEIDRLKLRRNDGVVPSGVFWVAYLKLKLRLAAAGFEVEWAPYDWRKPIAAEAARLMRRLRDSHARDVMLVCHSMGGLVARAMADGDQTRDVISRVITIGTPNQGSYSPVQLFRLKHGLLDTFGRFLDFTQSADDIARDVIRHFPGLIEMMPAPELSRFDFFDHDAWPSGGARPTARLMNAARQARDGLAPPDDRFHQLIGVGETTVVDARLEDDEFVFSVSDDGDGTVPRRLAAMGDVRRYFVEGEHMWLCNDDDVIAGVADILANGATSALSHAAPAADGVEIESRAPLTIARSLSGSADRRGAPNAATILHAMHDAPSRSESPPAAAGRSADSERANDHLRGYRLRDVLDAGRAWFDLASERRLMEAHVASGRSALAETPQRLDLYEKRLTRILASQPASLLRSVPRGMSAELAAEMRDDGVDAEALKRIRQERKIGEFEEFLSVEFLKRGGLALSPV
ncbi:MAG: hypothetical protein AAFU55_10815, partial [Pseudomonadota bacterium]